MQRKKGAGRDKAISIIVGTNVKTMRVQRNLSQEVLGKKLGITFQQVQKYEKGSNTISAARIPDLCRALNCSVEQLFDGTMESERRSPFPKMSSMAINVATGLDKLPKLRKAVKHLVDAMEGDA